MDYNKVQYNKDGSISLGFYNKKGFPQHTIDDRYFEIIKEIFFKLFSSDSDYVIPEENWEIYNKNPELFETFHFNTMPYFQSYDDDYNTYDIYDDYNTLGLQNACTIDELKKAYKKLSLRCHPDKINGDEEKFKQITGAYERLTGKNIDDEYVHTIIGQLIGKGGFNFKKFTKAFKAGCIMYENYIITISFHKDDSNKEEKFRELKNILLEKLDYIICNNQYNH